MARDLPSDVRRAYETIQAIVHDAPHSGGRSAAVMNRGFIASERRDVEDALVLLSVFADEHGYRRGFERGVRLAAERDREVSGVTEALGANPAALSLVITKATAYQLTSVITHALERGDVLSAMPLEHLRWLQAAAASAITSEEQAAASTARRARETGLETASAD